MNLANRKLRFLFAARLALVVVFVALFFSLTITPANVATDGWHIKDDATGGECSAIGIWNAVSKTCTLSQDLNQGIIIDSDNITLDGNGRTITGSNTGNGVFLSGRTGVTIKNLNVKRFLYGIYLYFSNRNALIKNTVSSNNPGYGLALSSSNNNTLTGNTASNNSDGIILIDSNGNTLLGNTALNNTYGIELSSSDDNSITGNTASNNSHGIELIFSNNNTITDNVAQENSSYDVYVSASSDINCDNIITNTTGSGGRPIKYFNNAVSLSNEILSELILCNADGSNINNIIIDGSATKKNNGLFLIRTDSSTITNVNSSNNNIGIYLYVSDNNTVIGNITNNTVTGTTASNNGTYGIFLNGSSDNNTVIGNTASNNTYGMYLYSANGNTLIGNTASNNYNGIALHGSSNNTLADNTANFNNYDGISLYGSSNNSNTLIGNTASNNTNGIHLSDSNNNTMTDNTASNNSWGILLYYYSNNNNQIYKNNFINNSTPAYVSGSGNVFNLDSPIGGNYWSNFDEPAEGCTNANSDGFCDSPYVFTGGQDNLPWTKKDGWLLPANHPPTLSYSQDAGYASDIESPGVDPNKGTANSTPFTFKVIYTDADNTSPNDIALVMDDGTAVSRHTMTLDAGAPDTLHDGNHTNGEQYTFSVQFSKGEYHYHFEASDGKGGIAHTPATGELSFKSGLFMVAKSNAKILAVPDVDSINVAGMVRTGDTVDLLPLTSDCPADGSGDCNNNTLIYKQKVETVNGVKVAYVLLKVRFHDRNDNLNEKTGFMVENKMMTIIPENQDARIMGLVDKVRGDFGVLHNFPRELFLGLIAAESDGTLNNEVTSVDSPFGGIKQVHPSLSGGLNRNCKDDSDGKRNCERATDEYNWTKLNQIIPITDVFLSPITDYGNIVRMGKNYINTRYNNTDEGIRLNISDGFHVLNDKFAKVLHTCAEGTGITTVNDAIAGAVDFGCEDKEIVKTIWYYNGFVNPTNYLRSVSDNMNPASLQNYYRGDFVDHEDLREKMIIAQRHYTLVKKFSPVFLRVYDSHDNIVGEFADGIQNTMENALYDPATESITIFFPEDETYRYTVIGTATGTYGLGIDSVNGATSTVFLASDIPVKLGEVYSYQIDSEALSRGEKGVTVKVDENGDGVFDYQFNASATLEDKIPPTTHILLAGKPCTNGWYTSDVIATLTAEDNIDGVGVHRTEYSLDNGTTWQAYVTPLILTQEGIHTLLYRSIDFLDNIETTHTQTIKIDKTPPEAKIFFDQNLKQLKIEGIDNLSSVAVAQNGTIYTLTDEAGHTLAVDFDKLKTEGKEIKAEISALRYDSILAPVIPENKLQYEWSLEKNGDIKELNQRIEIEKTLDVRARYDRKKNETAIDIKTEDEKDEEKTKQTFQGLTTLILTTNSGNFDIKYNH